MPKGQASTQLEQAMQRGLSDELHDAVLALLDGVGRADLRAGRVVAVPADVGGGGDASRCRSMKSKLIIDMPRCVSHSSQAFTHDWQPMQREGST